MSMSMMTNTVEAPQYLPLEDIFKIPEDIKNDIVYVQRAMRDYLKVHQRVYDMFKQNRDLDIAFRARIIYEIEDEIFIMNAEQNYLFLRLHRILDELFAKLRERGVVREENMTNALISTAIVPLINDSNYATKPITVSHRLSEDQLFEKYFKAVKPNVCEISDSDDSEDGTKAVSPKMECDLSPPELQEQPKPGPTVTNNLTQMSLLKPMAQRMVSNATTAAGYVDATDFLQVNMKEESVSSAEGVTPAVSVKIEEPPIELPVSKKVVMSRLNLRDALNRARSEKMAAKTAAASILARPPVAVVQAIQKAVQVKQAAPAPATTLVPRAVVAKKYDSKVRAARVTRAAVVAPKTSSSSSEDSKSDREATPPQVGWFVDENVELRTEPEHFQQEEFMSIFKLFTPAAMTQMQQRRSKRKRRTVHNNERADFHYGRIETGGGIEKKRKAFLLSPQVKRGLQSKRPKRSSADKLEEVATVASRSSSSSPDEKRGCNECLKRGGALEQCTDCKGFYHFACQRDDDKLEAATSARTVPQQKAKLCPACKRTQLKLQETQQYNALQNAAEELEQQLVREKDRHLRLQRKSKHFKTQMRNLFNIVNTFKSDQENDSSD